MAQTPAGDAGDPYVHRVIAGYRILKQAGKGGMGSVYLAREEASGRSYAFKILNSDLASSESHVRRFMREARIISALDHPHIIKIRTAGAADGLYYIVMDFVSGWTLVDLIRKNWIKSVGHAVQIAEQIALALAAAHERGVVHRDVKPHNVLMTKDMRVRLTDFGLAKETRSDTTSLTSTGNILGTPIYMAPEQWRGESPSAQTDIYALGVLLYEMLTGRPPFKADTPHAIMTHALRDELPPASNLNPQVDSALDRIIADMTAIDPAKRYQSAAALAEDLRAYRNGEFHKRHGQGYVMDSGIIRELTGSSAVAPPRASQVRASRLPGIASNAWRAARWSIGLAIAAVGLVALGMGLVQLPKLLEGVVSSDTAPVFTEDFESGMSRWRFLDPEAWRITDASQNHVLELVGYGNRPKATVIRPWSVALIDDQLFGSFDMTLRLKQTGNDYPGRDLCLFFGYQDANHYYFVHLGKEPKRASQTIFIVNGADGVPIADFVARGTPWDDNFHTARVRRDTDLGEISVYFDDLEHPVMSAVDKTFLTGKIGVGSMDDQGLFDDIRITRLDADTSDEAGFETLFNGTDFTGWIGNTDAYRIGDGELIGSPTNDRRTGHAIFTREEFQDFILRFEFNLTSGANSGIGLRIPAEVGISRCFEIQILDDFNPGWDTARHHAHGSIYGLAPSRAGQLRPAGQWNEEEIILRGRRVTVNLNGATILDEDLDTIASRPTLDGSPIPASLFNTSGHIGLLGNRSVVKFRNIRIKRL